MLVTLKLLFLQIPSKNMLVTIESKLVILWFTVSPLVKLVFLLVAFAITAMKDPCLRHLQSAHSP